MLLDSLIVQDVRRLLITNTRGDLKTPDLPVAFTFLLSKPERLAPLYEGPLLSARAPLSFIGYPR